VKNLFDISGKTAVITGGSRGLGQFIADGFVKAGVKVYISSRKADVCDATAKELSQYGECISLPYDLSDMAGVEGLASAVAEREGKVDILVNNAGATWGAPLETFPESAWDKVMDLNVKSIFFLTQKLLPQLRAAATAEDPARVINIGSIAGLRGGSGDAYSYAVSKAAVHHMTRNLASKLSADHITVNAIAPGPFRTKMMEFALKDDENRARIERGIPLGRIGSPDDILGVAAFLSSPAASYVTGSIISLDGGSSVGR
jgi:NAD(P)-dependent dehydrogenase (short-subunit alcohol dehydrogenase family)